VKLKYDEPLSNVAFNLNLRRYVKAIGDSIEINSEDADGSGATKQQSAARRAEGTALKVGRCSLTR